MNNEYKTYAVQLTNASEAQLQLFEVELKRLTARMLEINLPLEVMEDEGSF